MPVSAEDVLEIIDLLDAAGVPGLVVGGGGVDALLREHTRPHDDLDLWVAVGNDRSLRAALDRRGFVEQDGAVRRNYVLRDADDRTVDVHLATFQWDGSLVYEMDGGEVYVVPTDAFTTGWIGGSPVRCVSAEQQMIDHSTGYDPDEADRADMRALHDRFGVSYLPPFG